MKIVIYKHKEFLGYFYFAILIGDVTLAATSVNYPSLEACEEAIKNIRLDAKKARIIYPTD